MVAERLISVIGEPTSSDAPLRLSDLRRGQPADTTLRNLLGVLSAKLELCASLPVSSYLAKDDWSKMPTFSRTCRCSSPTASNQFCRPIE